MNVITKEIILKTKGENDMIDLSDDIAKELQSTKLQDGIVTIFTSCLLYTSDAADDLL